MNQKVILVNEKDQPIGISSKKHVHRLGLLHRAYSIFIFRNNKKGELELLLQQRAFNKYHSAGLWSNTCCSHPEPGSTILQHAELRLKEEMNFTSNLSLVDKFHYYSRLSNDLIENEIDYLLTGFKEIDKIEVNPKEVASYCWSPIIDIEKTISSIPEKFTCWFPKALSLVLKSLQNTSSSNPRVFPDE